MFIYKDYVVNDSLLLGNIEIEGLDDKDYDHFGSYQHSINRFVEGFDNGID